MAMSIRKLVKRYIGSQYEQMDGILTLHYRPENQSNHIKYVKISNPTVSLIHENICEFMMEDGLNPHNYDYGLDEMRQTGDDEWECWVRPKPRTNYVIRHDNSIEEQSQ